MLARDKRQSGKTLKDMASPGERKHQIYVIECAKYIDLIPTKMPPEMPPRYRTAGLILKHYLVIKPLQAGCHRLAK